MARNMAGEEATAGLMRRLRELWDSLAQRWPRRLRPGKPRLTRLRLAVLSIVVLLLVLWGAVAVSSTSIYSAQVVVLDSPAIGVPPPEGLDFGDIPRGNSAERKITFENNGRIPTAAVIVEWGGIRGLLKISDAFFTLDPGDKKEVAFRAEAPAGGEAKKYSGKVIVLRVPWWWP